LTQAIQQQFDQEFGPLIQQLDNVGNPDQQDSTDPSYPPGFSPADLGLPDYAQQLSDYMQQQALEYADEGDGNMHDDLGAILTLAVAGAAVGAGAIDGLIAAAAAIYGAAGDALTAAGVAAYNAEQWLGSQWQNIMNYFGSGEGAAAESAAADLQATDLTQQQQAAIRKIGNNIQDHLTPDDISGALRDMMGNPVPKPGGGYYDHLQELTNALQGLRRQADVLQGVNNPAAQAARQRALDAIRQVEDAIKGAGI
jgi:Bacterial toxin 28